MTQAAVAIQNLSKYYPLYKRKRDRIFEALDIFTGKSYHQKFFALSEINFSISRGECVGIIGLNGSGKSTLLQLIAGVLHPSEGAVAKHGTLAALLELGAGFNPEFTGIENVLFQCSMMGLSHKSSMELLPKILDFADIGDFVYQPVKTYSSGMYVRLAFAVSITVDPDILIVDEALAVGDVRFQAKCMKRITEFKKSGKTLLFVSHDAGAVKALCDRAILLDRGKLIKDGTPSEVFNTYNAMIADKDAAQLITPKSDNKHLRSGSQKVEILSVQMLNHDAQSTETFISGDSTRIEIKLKVNETVNDTAIGFLIRDRFGNDIFGCNNALLNQPIPKLLANSTILVSYDLPLNLGAHLYTLTVAVHSGEDHISDNYDWINDVHAFRVYADPNFKFAGYARILPNFSYKTL